MTAPEQRPVPGSRVFLCGVLMMLAGFSSDDPKAWVVWAFGLALVVAVLLRPVLDRPSVAPQRTEGRSVGQSPYEERITRERQRETRERRYHDAA